MCFFSRSRGTVPRATGGHPSRGTQPMRDDVRIRLESAFSSHSIERQLHDVPPHEVYEILVDGRRAVYKGDIGPTGKAGVEGRVTDFVGEETSIPVPETLLVEEDFYVAAWHPAAPSPDEGQPADETWASAAGRGLAMLHDETAPLLDSYGAFRPGPELTTERHDEFHAAALAYLSRRRPVLDRYGHADMADRAIEVLADCPDAFAGVDGPVCCHGWATPEHVSVVDGEVACVIDFEHALAAPGEYDYWRTVFPAFGEFEADDAHQAFREAYESVRPLPEGFSRRRRFYALLNGIYYFESLYVQDQHGPEETTDRAQRLRDNVGSLLDDLADGGDGGQ